jgi:hypothetical protein
MGARGCARSRAVTRARRWSRCAQAEPRAKIPDPGPTVSGAGGGGKIGASNNTLLTQYLLEKGGMKKLEEQIDPREAFLRHKDAAELAPWTKAYAKTQPKKLFSEPEEGEEGGGK